MLSKSAGLLYGPLEHHLDHIAPFCSLARIPLVITDEEIAEQARLYYPNLNILEWNCLEAPFKIVERFESLYCTIARPFYDELFFIAEKTLNKKLQTFWLPHGNSDKGHHVPLLEALKDENTLLVYGPKMIDFLKLKGISKPYIETGNFRLEYYRRHRSFYQKMIDPWCPPGAKIILYAPSWEDGETSTSFFKETKLLISHIPSGFCLWIKPHPNLEKDIRTEQLALQYSQHPQVKFLRHFAPIYPILEKTDIYLGDMSSIGYDFLAFNRPMFFFNPNKRPLNDPGLFLHRCGHTLESSSQFFKTLDQDQSHLTEIRQETYTYVFG